MVQQRAGAFLTEHHVQTARKGFWSTPQENEYAEEYPTHHSHNIPQCSMFDSYYVYMALDKFGVFKVYVQAFFCPGWGWQVQVFSQNEFRHGLPQTAAKNWLTQYRIMEIAQSKCDDLKLAYGGVMPCSTAAGDYTDAQKTANRFCELIGKLDDARRT